MLKQLKFWDEVNEFRKRITKPKILPPKEALEEFKKFLAEKHNITDMDSAEGRAFVKKYKEFAGSAPLMEYIGL